MSILTTEQGSAVKATIDKLVERYKYRKLPADLSRHMIAYYEANLPQLEGNKALYSLNGEVVANGFERIVIGDYGAYIEIPQELITKPLYVAKGEEFRTLPNFKGKYIWLTTLSGCCKIYKQLRTVSYADYKVGMYYISPYEVKQEIKTSTRELIQPKEEIPGYLVNRTIKEGCSDILTCMVTGHRPQSLGGWNFNDAKNLAIMEYVRRVVFKLYAENGTRIFINGTAAGGDLMFARAVLDLKAQYPDAQLWNFIPYPSDKDRFKYQWKQIYDASIAAGSENIVCSPDPEGEGDDARRKDVIKKIFFRNEKMVEALSPTGMIIAIYSGLPAGLYTIQQVAEMLASEARGGTVHTLLTAVKRHRNDKNFCPQVFVINPGNF